MRILTIVRNFGRRGTQRVAECFSAAYRRLEHEVAVLVFEHEGPRFPNYLAHGIDVLPPYQTDPDGALGRALKFNPDIIHIHRSGVTRSDETRILSTLKRQSNCVLETNVFSRFDPHADPYIDLHGQLTRPGIYRWQRLENGRSRGVGFYLPNVLDYDVWRAPSIEHAERLRREIGIPDDAIILGTIGKTHMRLGRVVERVISSAQQAYWVAIEDGLTRQLVHALPRRLKDRCRLLPQTDSDQTLTHYYSLFDLLLHWSANGESFGMVLAESIAIGTPIIMPLQLHRDIGGVEVVGHEQGGLIAGSSGGLTHTCQTAISRLPHLLRSIPLAQARHRQEYDMMTVAQKSIRAAQTVLQASNHREERTKLLQASGFEVAVSPETMKKLIQHHTGKRSLLETALFSLTHNSRFNDLRRMCL